MSQTTMLSNTDNPDQKAAGSHGFSAGSQAASRPRAAAGAQSAACGQGAGGERPQWWHDVIPSMGRNALWHDYCAPRIYMFTMRIAEGLPPLSTISDGDIFTTDRERMPKALPTSFGRELWRILSITACKCLALELWDHVLMPDHIHFIVRVTERIDVPVTRYIGYMRSQASSHFKDIAVPGQDRKSYHKGTRTIWADKAQHTVLSGKDQLANMKNYIADNPRRLAIKRRYPNLFRVQLHVHVGEDEFAALGNIFLLRKSEFINVVVHRAWSDEQKRAYHAACISAVRNGAVLVSPFISPYERAIMKEAMQIGGNIIKLELGRFSERPSLPKSEFEYCSQGRLLLLAPWDCKEECTREKCLTLNAMAKSLADARRHCVIDRASLPEEN